MSCIQNQVDNRDGLEVIREEQGSSPTASSSTVRVVTSKHAAEELQKDLMKCICKQNDEASKVKIAPSHVEEILKEKEKELREEYERILEREKELIKDRFSFILSNEQTRASYMLREAHRERQEKIRALQTQLQCKNLAALMYVMCTERRRSRLDKLKIIEDYTNYINVLHDILSRGQELILHLSRGYKTAARVDNEWREKMKRVVSEFMVFIYHYAGGDPETNQYLIDLPKLLKTKAPIEVNPEEDPCDCYDDEEDTPFEDKRYDTARRPVRTRPGSTAKARRRRVVFHARLKEMLALTERKRYRGPWHRQLKEHGFYTPAAVEEKEWWEDLNAENSPFVMYGDIADFDPDRRRQVLKQLKEASRIRAQKTAPAEWKEISFKDMYMKSDCVHLDKIKNVYPDKLPVAVKWECTHSPPDGDFRLNSKTSILPYNRQASSDYRGTMGSILKIIASGPSTAPVPAKTELLGARDSIEITSATKLPSAFVDIDQYEEFERTTPPHTAPTATSTHDDQNNDESISILGSIHNDSLQMIQTRNPEPDHRIYYERVCPMEKCQRMQVDSFMRTLPSYMRANPFTHFAQTFDQYETCTPEQLKILQERIELKMHKKDLETYDDSGTESPLSEWLSTGVGVQTSHLNLLPPCTCQPDGPEQSQSPSDFILNLADLEPVKLAMDAVHRECLFDDSIDFDRFKLIGQEIDSWKTKKAQQEADFKQSRYQEISEILEKHPSLLDIFQANAK